jgi:nifR3 family TIM-barrel protein
MILGNLTVHGKVFCAPMAGISNPAYRILARRFGAAVVYTEMISSHGLTYENKKTTDMLAFTTDEQPIGIQLFGANPEIMYKAAQIVSRLNPDLIDLNFGCPVKKVVKKNGGAAVLKDLGLTKALIEATVAGGSQPVTVKLRSGWDELSKIYAEAGKVAEEAGAAAITLHARTRSEAFGGTACWEDIRRLKETVSIPVVGNGDVKCGEDAQQMLAETGCDAVMIGRAALGNPWIFREINHHLETGENLPSPTLDEKISVILEHARLMMSIDGEQRAILKMRHIVTWYVKGWSGGGQIRRLGTKISAFSDLENILNEYRDGKLAGQYE